MSSMTRREVIKDTLRRYFGVGDCSLLASLIDQDLGAWEVEQQNAYEEAYLASLEAGQEAFEESLEERKGLQ